MEIAIHCMEEEQIPEVNRLREEIARLEGRTGIRVNH